MRLVIVSLALGAVAAGCGGSPEGESPALQPGVYTYELTEEYLRESGISPEQASNESGSHRATLRADGAFTDTWTTARGSTGQCTGTYEEADAGRVTFRWTNGCFGDWEMSYAVDGDIVTWSDQEALPPYDSEEDQMVNEVFNSVPWTRVGDVS